MRADETFPLSMCDNATVAVNVSQISASHVRDVVGIRWDFGILNCTVWV